MPPQDTRSDLAGRFWSNVDERGPDDCWLWTGKLRYDGYGRLTMNGQTTGTHRVAWTLAHGPIAAGLHVLHRCDNPPCCNPSHLFLGTHADNLRDRWTKRSRPRTGGPVVAATDRRAVLRAEQVTAIRRRHAEGGVTHDDLARAFGVGRATVSFILSRRSWAHLP